MPVTVEISFKLSAIVPYRTPICAVKIYIHGQLEVNSAVGIAGARAFRKSVEFRGGRYKIGIIFCSLALKTRIVIGRPAPGRNRRRSRSGDVRFAESANAENDRRQNKKGNQHVFSQL